MNSVPDPFLATVEHVGWPNHSTGGCDGKGAAVSDDPVIEIEVELCNRDGLHARPVSRLVEIANRFDAALTIVKDGQEADGRSVLQLLTLAAPKGTRLKVIAHGHDAEPLTTSIREEIEKGFGEELR